MSRLTLVRVAVAGGVRGAVRCAVLLLPRQLQATAGESTWHHEGSHFHPSLHRTAFHACLPPLFGSRGVGEGQPWSKVRRRRGVGAGGDLIGGGLDLERGTAWRTPSLVSNNPLREENCRASDGLAPTPSAQHGRKGRCTGAAGPRFQDLFRHRACESGQPRRRHRTAQDVHAGTSQHR